jgi:hypothetical protein
VNKILDHQENCALVQKKLTLREVKGDLKTYFNWSANALCPVNPGAADRFLKENQTAILTTAQKLLKLVRYVPGLIYRGILLKQPVNEIVPHERLEYLSFSTDRSVAEHFADINGFGSEVMDLAARLGNHGYIIEYTPNISEVLFHHHLLSVLPYAEAFSQLGMDGTSEVEGLKSQKEVTILQPELPFRKITEKVNKQSPSLKRSKPNWISDKLQ